MDGGKTWKNVGLRDSRAIGKVIIDPRDPDIAFVAALGHPYGPNAERGVFRTLDGGKTWEKVLYKDENTGAIDITFDPHNANILFAALWQVRRGPGTSIAADPAAGFTARTTAAPPGSSLKRNGLPKDRMAASASPVAREL